MAQGRGPTRPRSLSSIDDERQAPDHRDSRMRAFRRSQVVAAELSATSRPSDSYGLPRPEQQSSSTQTADRSSWPWTDAQSGWHALEWAAAEAAARQCSLRIVHVRRLAPSVMGRLRDLQPGSMERGHRGCRRALDTPRSGRPGPRRLSPLCPLRNPPASGPTQQQLCCRPPVGTRSSVLGRARTPRQGRSFTTSVSQQVARRARRTRCNRRAVRRDDVRALPPEE
jgi:hypothetical protein